MLQSKASAQWNGTLTDGTGTLSTGSGAIAPTAYTFASRFEGMQNASATNPEELIGAAHAGCFSMALAGNLVRQGANAQNIETEATVNLDKTGDGFRILSISLQTRVSATGIDVDAFQKIAEDTRSTCPVSQALAAVPISLDAQLV